jgi:MSHA pilin protein MshD
MSAALSAPSRQSGVTLIELVISIVIVAIAVSAVLGTLTYASNSSADALVRNQSVAIANAYLEEILLKPYSDPDTTVTGETARTAMDDVADYNGLSNVGARDQFDQPISGLSNYNVDVQVTDEALSGVATKRVDVTVTANGLTTRLSGYRASY